MRRASAWSLICLIACTGALAQGVIGQVLSGDLVNPKVGAWAWYDLTDAATDIRFLVRQAIVGNEKVGRKTGYWIEIEVVPRIGYKTIYKMLLTGPATDPKHVHKVLLRDGPRPVNEVSISDDNKKNAPPDPNGEDSGAVRTKDLARTSLGEEDVPTLGGTIRAEHFELTPGDQKVELWLNDDVRPMGIVKMKSPEGELVLRNHGVGGPDARSIIDEEPVPGTEERSAMPELRVRVQGPDVQGPNEDDPESRIQDPE